jgi:hypothetical protein
MPTISKSFTDHWVRSPMLNVKAACVALSQEA